MAEWDVLKLYPQVVLLWFRFGLFQGASPGILYKIYLHNQSDWLGVYTVCACVCVFMYTYIPPSINYCFSSQLICFRFISMCSFFFKAIQNNCFKAWICHWYFVKPWDHDFKTAINSLKIKFFAFLCWKFNLRRVETRKGVLTSVLVDTNKKAIEAQWSSNVPQETQKNIRNLIIFLIDLL